MAQRIIETVEKELFDVFLKYLSLKNPIFSAQGRNSTQTPHLAKQQVKKSVSGIEKIISESFGNVKEKTSTIGDFIIREFEAEKKTDEKSNASFSLSYDSAKKDRLRIVSDSISLSSETENRNPWNEPYGMLIRYERRNGTERISISYYEQADNYLAKHMMEKEDMSLRVPLKWLNILPESMMGGILGFTYLGDNSMGRRADLTGGMARMVDIHESIHTPDEYETRVLTDWILERPLLKYKK